ncbi:MAG: flagellar basal body-associated FliL family protein [Lachnospiraceae bacterium]|nr:flagellar basal body-associated FliL family protein [Lachnospiraceae bacterium]
MKKNMLSIIILALLIVNLAMTGILMFSQMGTTKKTARLIDGISTALSLEIAEPSTDEAAEAEEVPIDAIAVYKIPDQMTIQLAKGADGATHYCLVSVSLSMNTLHEDYEKYGAKVGDSEDLIKGEIFDVIGSHPIEEAESNPDLLREEILKRIQKLYGSDFIYNVVFRDVMFQ